MTSKKRQAKGRIFIGRGFEERACFRLGVIEQAAFFCGSSYLE